MARSYTILRVISTSPKGAQVTAIFEGKVVTRHLVKGYGKHPDDQIASKHEKARLFVDRLVSEVDLTQKAIPKAEADLLDPTLDAKVKRNLARQLPFMRAFVLSGPQRIEEAAVKLQDLLDNDPLQVRYEPSASQA